jgi:hypothetical protein
MEVGLDAGDPRHMAHGLFQLVGVALGSNYSMQQDDVVLGHDLHPG